MQPVISLAENVPLLHHPRRWDNLGSEKDSAARIGEGKAKIIEKSVEGYATSSIPATFLQDHPNTLFLLDEAAAQPDTRRISLVLGEINWDPATIRVQ